MPGDHLTCAPRTDVCTPKRRVRSRPLGLAGWENAGWGVIAGQERSAFLDSLSRGRAGVGVERRRAGGGGGGGEEQPPCTSPSPLALQQPDFPEMMGRRRPMGALAALWEAGPGLGWGNPAKCLDCRPAPLPWQIAPLLRRGRTSVRARSSRGQREPCPAEASRAQWPRDPGILYLLPAPTRNRAHRFGTLGSRRPFAPAAEVSLPSTRGREGDGWHRTKTRGAPGSGG